MKDKVGIAHGRFQLLHKGHMEYLLAAKSRCEHLIVGISNPDPAMTREHFTDLERSKQRANPLTYFERFEMLRDALIAEGVTQEEFDIVPFPINYPERLKNYAPTNAKYYITIYDQWGWTKERLLRELGYDVEIMWVRTMEERFTSGTEVRHKICCGEPWKDLVPHTVYTYIVSHGLEEHIRRVNK